MTTTQTGVGSSILPGLTVLSITRGQDTGGQSWRIYNAFRRLAPEWTFRSIIRANTFLYLQYPEDLTWYDAKEWWRKADVIHVHNTFEASRILEPRGGKRPMVIHHHGGAFRRNPGALVYEQRQRGALGIVSTLDLWLLAPEDTEWLPAPYDLDWLASLKEPTRAEASLVQAIR